MLLRSSITLLLLLQAASAVVVPAPLEAGPALSLAYQTTDSPAAFRAPAPTASPTPKLRMQGDEEEPDVDDSLDEDEAEEDVEVHGPLVQVRELWARAGELSHSPNPPPRHRARRSRGGQASRSVDIC